MTRRDLERKAEPALVVAANGEALAPVPPVEAGRVSSILHRAVVTARSYEPLRVLVHRMAETGFTRVPVVDAGDPTRLVGLITLKDVLKARVRHLEEERRREVVLPLGEIVSFARVWNAGRRLAGRSP